MLVAFELSMPGIGSWNRKWSGEGRPYVRVRKLSKQQAEKALQKTRYAYDWRDGWCAAVSVRRVDSKEAAKLRKKSVGFFGYDWMIDSIIENGIIAWRGEAEGEKV